MKNTIEVQGFSPTPIHVETVGHETMATFSTLGDHRVMLEPFGINEVVISTTGRVRVNAIDLVRHLTTTTSGAGLTTGSL